MTLRARGTQLTLKFFNRSSISIHNYRNRALAGSLFGNGRTDPLCSAGNEYHLVSELQVHCVDLRLTIAARRNELRLSRKFCPARAQVNHGYSPQSVVSRPCRYPPTGI